MVTNAQIIFLSKTAFNYREHRKIPLEQIEAITVCHDPTIFEVIIHIKNSFDERLSCVTKENKHNLLGVIEALLTEHGHSYNYFVAEDTKLKKWVTLKADSEKKKFKRPSEDMIDSSHKSNNFRFAAIEGSAILPHDHSGATVELEVLEQPPQLSEEDQEKAMKLKLKALTH